MMKTHSASTKSESQVTSTSVNPKMASNRSRLSPWLTPIAYFLGRKVVLPMFFGDIQIAGQENIPSHGPVIIAPTHRSRWDSLLLPYAAGRYVSGRDMRFMVTMNECKGLQGWFVRRLGGFPVDPQRPAIATLRHTVELMKRGEMLVIYPEGGIFQDGKVHPLKSGVTRLALTAESMHSDLEIKIIPVGINYSQSFPNWGTDVMINIGEPIRVKDHINGSLKKDAVSLTQYLKTQLQKLSYHPAKETVSQIISA